MWYSQITKVTTIRIDIRRVFLFARAISAFRFWLCNENPSDGFGERWAISPEFSMEPLSFGGWTQFDASFSLGLLFSLLPPAASILLSSWSRIVTWADERWMHSSPVTRSSRSSKGSPLSNLPSVAPEYKARSFCRPEGRRETWEKKTHS